MRVISLQLQDIKLQLSLLLLVFKKLLHKVDCFLSLCHSFLILISPSGLFVVKILEMQENLRNIRVKIS